MTGTNCDLFTHKSSRSYLNHLVFFILLFDNYNHSKLLNLCANVDIYTIKKLCVIQILIKRDTVFLTLDQGFLSVNGCKDLHQETHLL